MKKIHEIYIESPEEALEETFNQYKNDLYTPGRIFIWVSSFGDDGVRYGKFRYVSKNNINGRDYNIEFWDGEVSLSMTDTTFDPRTRKFLDKKTNTWHTDIFWNTN